MKRFAAVALVAALMTSGAFADVIAGDDFDGGLPFLTFTQTPAPGAFSSAGDGFETYQVGVSPSIPYTLVDDSNSTYPADTLGIIDSATKFDAWFGAVDLNNGDNPDGTGIAEWTFDVAGYIGLAVTIDMGAMGDFEAGGDVYDWTYSIDGGTTMPLFTSSIDEDGMQSYTMAGGAVVDLDDPMLMNGTLLTNNLETFAADVTGTGSVLTLTLNAMGDGGSEGYAFDNIVVTGVPEPGALALLVIGSLLLVRRR